MCLEFHLEIFKKVSNLILIEQAVEGYAWLLVRRGPLTFLFTNMKSTEDYAKLEANPISKKLNINN